MKIFSCNQTYIPKPSMLTVSNQQTSKTLPERNIGYNYSPNLYFHPVQISFGAMKKTQFSPLNRTLVEKFKAPIEKFNTESDFQDWSKEQAEKIANKDYGGRQAETVEQRKHMLKEWGEYVLKENDAYTSATALLILSAVTKDLKPDNDEIPPVLNKGVLADCISEIDKNSKSDSKYTFNLRKMYETKLKGLYLEGTQIDGGETGWVIIPSKTNDPENFEANVDKLKALSHKTWCTKSFNAEPYLSKGDFHVYLENGQPKLGVRFVEDKIQEIQGELNNNKIPLSHLEVAKKHIDENGLKLTSNASAEIQKAETLKIKVDKVKKDLKTAIETNDAETIFKYFGIDAETDKDGFLTISEYRQPDEFLFADCGIDENKLVSKVKVIRNNAHFQNSQITSLSNLQSIGRCADFSCSKVTNLDNLQSIGGWADFVKSRVKNLDRLESIGAWANFSNSQIISLKSLQSIGGYADFKDSLVTELPKLQSIGGNAYFINSQVKNLDRLRRITKGSFIS